MGNMRRFRVAKRKTVLILKMRLAQKAKCQLYLTIYLHYQPLKICSVNLKGGIQMVLRIKSEQCEMPQKSWNACENILKNDNIRCQRVGQIKIKIRRGSQITEVIRMFSCNILNLMLTLIYVPWQWGMHSI